MSERIFIMYEITLYVRVLDSRGMEVSLLLIRRTSYYCTDSYPAISFLICRTTESYPGISFLIFRTTESYPAISFLILRICRTKWQIWESSQYGWHCLDVYLTRLASELGQARQKYVCMVHL